MAEAELRADIGLALHRSVHTLGCRELIGPLDVTSHSYEWVMLAAWKASLAAFFCTRKVRFGKMTCPTSPRQSREKISLLWAHLGLPEWSGSPRWRRCSVCRCLPHLYPPTYTHFRTHTPSLVSCAIVAPISATQNCLWHLDSLESRSRVRTHVCSSSVVHECSGQGRGLSVLPA